MNARWKRETLVRGCVNVNWWKLQNGENLYHFFFTNYIGKERGPKC